jgi:hypothetical protein
MRHKIDVKDRLFCWSYSSVEFGWIAFRNVTHTRDDAILVQYSIEMALLRQKGRKALKRVGYGMITPDR